MSASGARAVAAFAAGAELRGRCRRAGPDLRARGAPGRRRRRPSRMTERGRRAAGRGARRRRRRRRRAGRARRTVAPGDRCPWAHRPERDPRRPTPAAAPCRCATRSRRFRCAATRAPQRRVVLRYVPFKPGNVFDVDDPEVELSRYRLLGTGFFRDVQFSLKKGSERGLVVLVIDVTERNTIVINDISMGLAADADRNGRVRRLSGYAGLDVAETNLAGTGITLGGAMAFASRPAGAARALPGSGVSGQQLDGRRLAALQRRARFLRQRQRVQWTQPGSRRRSTTRPSSTTRASAARSASGVICRSARSCGCTTGWSR